MEAMAAGKPVVAADAMALPHLVHPGRNGHLFPPGDVRALAGHLTALADNPETLRRMGEAGRRIVADHDIRRSWAPSGRLTISRDAERPSLSEGLTHCRR
jgi:glycosyltransferase involved in cell wall biosynthesis